MISFPKPDIEEFFRTYAITGFAVSRDERRLAFSTNLGGQYNLWGLDIEQGYPYPLTYVDQVPHSIRFDPQGRYILVGFDRDGDENVQLYAITPAGGSPTPVRTHAGRRHYLAAVSEDGNRVYYCSDKDNHTYLNGYVYDLNTGEERVLYQGTGGSTHLLQVAPDESSFVFVRLFANSYMVGYVQAGDEVRALTPDENVPHVVYSPEYLGEELWFATDFGEDRAYLASFNLSTGSFQKRLQIDGADIVAVAVHRPSQTLYLCAARGVEDRLYAYHVPTGEGRPIDLPVAVVEDIQVGESGMVYLLGRSDVDPFNLYLRSPDGVWRKLTDNRVMGVAREQLSAAEVVHFASYDGLELEALWFPANPESANGYTVVWPHGGPQAAERKMFRPFFQYLCNRGYNVWAPNFRGSTGYGTKFMRMVEGDWGEGPRLDMLASIEWLLSQKRADRDKLFLVGGSYGGYMTLLLHGRHAEWFQACVDIFGPSNLFTFLESVPDHWKPIMRQWLGDPEADKERLTADSPITYLDGMTKPMLVIQGANDPRVVKAESDQIVDALRQRGTEVEYIVFEDEGHGFMKKQNEMEAYRRIVEFLDKHRQ
ncbi:S9 family peptidase [Alicyclobacillus shizuokensis]|uniref:S9 family peptidase n=1 Tax=Alicyclobacillus shizuokensis TaxID=392014 RepID=UPI000830CCA2|nr:S9 family peptidase [Alicyclobacillus shizuokensis]MCL6626491.1 S9 family peptidase [Alicyclobacillus shizuokensis]